MAQVFAFDDQTGLVFYGQVDRTSDYEVWTGTGNNWEVYNSAHRGQYAVALPVNETVAGSYRYQFTFPIAITTPGNYRVTVFQGSGVLGDAPVREFYFEYDGAAEIDAQAVDARVLLNLDAKVSAVGGGGGGGIITGYAAGQDPATLLLLSPTHKLATDASGFVTATNGGSGSAPTAQQVADAVMQYPDATVTTIGAWAKVLRDASVTLQAAVAALQNTSNSNNALLVDVLSGQADLETAIAALNTLGNGLYSVTVTVHDNLANLVAGAVVTILDASGTTPVAWGYTNTNGVIVFALDAGTYKVLVASGPNYTPLAIQTLSITGSASVTYTLIRQVPTAPVAGGLCTVQFFVSANRVPQVNYTVQAKFLRPNQAVDNELLSLAITDAITDSTGYAELQLVRSDFIVNGDGVYGIEVVDPDGNVAANLHVAIPAQASINFQDLL